MGASKAGSENVVKLQKTLPDDGKKQIKLGFSIMAHNELPLLEVLLSTIFRPYHSYCIFVDAKAPQEFLRYYIICIYL